LSQTAVGPIVLVVGAGPAGLRAAGDLAGLGIPVHLVERKAKLGGAPIHYRYKTLAPELRPTEEVMDPLIAGAEKEPLVTIHRESLVSKLEGTAGAFQVTIKSSATGAETNVAAAAVVTSTGFEHFDASLDPRYEYGRAKNVIGIHELEGMLKDGKVLRHDGKPPQRVAFIFCVGSRDRATNPWCCTVCCGVSIKQGIELKQLFPESEIYMIYIDIRTFGLWENLYWSSMEDHGINFIRGRVSQIFDTGTQLLVKGEDTLVRGPFEVLMDMVVLAVGINPGDGTAQAAAALGLEKGEFGFLKPKHPNVHYESAKEGVFLAGTCVAPMSVEEAILGGSAAAMQAAKLLRRLSLAPAR